MKKLYFNRPQSALLPDINMSPLIDCIFILLIFFIVTTTFIKDTAIRVDRPRAISSEQIAETAIRLLITADGLVYMGDQHIPLNRVRGLLARQIAADHPPVVIIADRACPSGRLIALLDECKLAGTDPVSVATVKD